MTGEALCFDMYGTLCDTSSVTATLGAELGVADGLVAAVDGLWREKQLQYSFQRGQMDDYAPFRTVTAEALDYALDYHDLDPGESTRERIRAAYDHLDPFPDAVDALERLADAGHEVAVLSNGNPEMLETLAANAGLDPNLDAILSAEAARTFKPAAAVYEAAAQALDRPVGDCRLVSANAWDVAGAAAAGMGTAWVNRGREPPERVGGDADLTVASLGDLADELA